MFGRNHERFDSFNLKGQNCRQSWLEPAQAQAEEEEEEEEERLKRERKTRRQTKRLSVAKHRTGDRTKRDE